MFTHSGLNSQINADQDAALQVIQNKLLGTVVQDGLHVEHQVGNSVNYIHSKGNAMAYLEVGGAPSTEAVQAIVNIGTDAGNSISLEYTKSGDIFRIKRVNSGTATTVMSFTKASDVVTFSGALVDSNGGTLTTAEKAKIGHISISQAVDLDAVEASAAANATAIALRTTKGLNRCLEKISGICDGRKLYPDYLKGESTTYITLTDITAAQAGTAGSWVDVAGSSIAYIPPAMGEYASTTRGCVIYKFSFLLGRTGDGEGLVSFQCLLDGTEIEGKATQVHGSGGFYGSHVTIELPIQIDSGETTSLANAVLSSWGSSTRTIKVQMFEYASGTEVRVHQPYYWEALYESNSTPLVSQPTISIETYGYG